MAPIERPIHRPNRNAAGVPGWEHAPPHPQPRAEPARSSPVDGAGEDSVNRNVDRKSKRLNSSHLGISYAVFCLKKKINLTVPVVAILSLRVWADLPFTAHAG